MGWVVMVFRATGRIILMLQLCCGMDWRALLSKTGTDAVLKTLIVMVFGLLVQMLVKQLMTESGVNQLHKVVMEKLVPQQPTVNQEMMLVL